MSKKYSGIVQVENFFKKKSGKGFYKVGSKFESESEQAILYYKRINKLK